MNELEKKLGLTEVSPIQQIADHPSGYVLKQIPKAEQSYEMLVSVCSLDGMALKHASRKLITQELCEIAVNQNGLAISYVPDRIIKASDIAWLRYICELAVSQNGLAIEFLPESTIKTDDIEWLNHLYKEAARSNGRSLRLIPDEFKSPEIVEAAILSNGYLDYISKHDYLKSPIAYVPKDMLTEELIHTAVEHFPLCIKDIPQNQITKAVSEIAVSKNGLALQYIPDQFIDEGLISTAVSENAHAIQYVPEEHLTSELCLRCFEKDCTVLGYLPAELITEEMCQQTIKQRRFTVIMPPDRILIERFGTVDVNLVVFSDFPESLRNSHTLLEEIIHAYKLGLKLLHIWNENLRQRKNIKKEYVEPLRDETAAYLKSIERTQKTEDINSPQDYSLISCSSISAYTKKAKLPDHPDLPVTDILVSSRKNALTVHDLSLGSRDTWKLYYISDIHIEHQLLKEANKIPQRSKEKQREYISKFIEKKISRMMPKEEIDSNTILLIGGDVADSVGLSALFYDALLQRWKGGAVISVLGNHELWDGTNPASWMRPRFKSRPIEDIIASYQSHIDRGRWRDAYSTDCSNSFLLENALFLRYKDRAIRILSEKTILSASDEDLTDLLRKCTFILLGGIGYSGLNPKYNSDMGLYRKAITSLEEDKRRAERFRKLHDKIRQCAAERRVVVLTHTPVSDWTDDECVKNWIYVNGHTHQNALNITPDGITVLSDNQIGYKPVKWQLHSFTMDIGWYDPFDCYEDGIYTISSDQYRDFNRGRGIRSNGCSWPGDLYMLKRKKKYMFLLQSDKSLCLMSGGARKGLERNDIQYYYNNMERYVERVLQITEPYQRFMKQLSEEVKKFGGEGGVHGCIVDISFLSHIYVNPFDGALTPYWALDITERIVYDNIQMLLEAKEKPLLRRFLIQCEKQSLPLIGTYMVSDSNIYEPVIIPRWMTGTEIYDPSRIMRSIQYVWEQDVIRIWNDEILDGNYLDAKPPLIEYNGNEIV